ncbi:hypothetical protein KSF78_0001065 [Schistosoma japonicum]|nr:hypothetical protein KSF78_0001065 [Schistosoma japonicum]
MQALYSMTKKLESRHDCYKLLALGNTITGIIQTQGLWKVLESSNYSSVTCLRESSTRPSATEIQKKHLTANTRRGKARAFRSERAEWIDRSFLITSKYTNTLSKLSNEVNKLKKIPDCLC